MNTGRVVQYGRRSSAKHRQSPSSSAEPSPKRQKIVANDGDEPGDASEPQSGRATAAKDSHPERQIPTAPNAERSNGKQVQDAFKASGYHAADTTITRVPVTPSRTYNSSAKSRRIPPTLVAERERSTPPLVPTRPNTPTRSPSPAPGNGLARTPSKKPKDLSGLFAPLLELPTSPSPGKSIASRMLFRSRTEPSSPSSLSSLTPPRPVAAAASLPTIPASFPQPEEKRLPSPPAAVSPSPVTTRSNFRTYSQSRSFLVALPAASMPHSLSARNTHFGIPTDATFDPDEEVRESYDDLRTRWGVDHSEDDPYHVPGITNELMSITELRSKGESRRFLDEVGYLFEGLEEQGMTISVKRSSAVEIVLKMCDTDFMRKAKAADFIGRAWDAMRFAGAGDGDKILNPCLAFFVALVAHDKRDIDELARKHLFFEAMIRLLATERENDGLLQLEDVDARRMGLSKLERLALLNLRRIILNNSDFTSLPSTRCLVSYALSCATPSFPAQLLPAVLPSLLTELALLGPRIDAYASGLALLPLATPGIPDLAHIDHCLRILDTFLLGAWGRNVGQERIDEEREALGTGLVALYVAAGTLEFDNEWRTLARQCIESGLRVLINLSHGSVEWCKLLLGNPLTLPVIIPLVLPHQGPVKREEDAEMEDSGGTESLDRQCLALALLTNIVFGAEEASDSIRDTYLNPSCPRATRCARICHCPEQMTAIESMVGLFIRLGPTAETAHVDFFRSHLAALLCLLTAANPANRGICWKAFPGMGAREKFDGLARSVRQFLDLYSEGEGEVLSGSEGAVAERVLGGLEALEA